MPNHHSLACITVHPLLVLWRCACEDDEMSPEPGLQPMQEAALVMGAVLHGQQRMTPDAGATMLSEWSMAAQCATWKHARFAAASSCLALALV